MGTCHLSHSTRPYELALRDLGRQEGAGERRRLPGCGASRVRHFLTPDRPSLGCAARAHYPLAVGARGFGLGTRHQPHSARTCELALRAVGEAQERPGGGASCLPVGRPGFGALSRPTARPWGVRPGPTTHWLRVLGSRAWRPATNPIARALASRLRAFWGGHEAARGGRLLPVCGASGVGRSPSPGRPSFGACGRGPLPTGCGCGGCGRGNLSPTPQLALLRAGLARWGAARGCPAGGRLLRGSGASRVGRSFTPDRPSFEACGRGPLPVGCGCGGCGLGDPSPTPQRALLRAGFAHCAGSTRAPGGGTSCLGVGLRGRTLSHPRPPGL